MEAHCSYGCFVVNRQIRNVETTDRRITTRRINPPNIYVYCKQIDIYRGCLVNLSARGLMIKEAPEKAYVGRRVSLVLTFVQSSFIKLIRASAVITHTGKSGVGFGFVQPRHSVARPYRSSAKKIV